MSDRSLGLGSDCEPQPRGKSQHAQHSYRVFPVALSGVTDNPDNARRHIGLPSQLIDQVMSRGVVVKGVNREIPALRVFL